MTPDDPRHGTEAGHEQHLRDDEPPCTACDHGKLIAARRRSKRKNMGYRYTLPLGDMHAKLVDWRNAGASLDDIALYANLGQSQVWRMLNAGPDEIVYTRTYLRIANAPAHPPVTTIGVTRRIQALSWLGYSLPKIALEAGVNHDTILDARAAPREFVAQKVKTGVAGAYDRLHMTVPQGETQQQRAGISRVRNYARKQGWLPPLAWTCIDDQRECPTGWEYKEGDRSTYLQDLVDGGGNISDACRTLKTSRDALQQWCKRRDLSELYLTLTSRELRTENQHTRDVA